MSNVEKKVKEKVMGNKLAMRAFVGASAASFALTPILAFAENEGTAASVASDVSSITTMATSVLSLFTTFPLNIILAMGLTGGVIGVVAKLKRSAR